MLKRDEGILSLRGRWFDWKSSDGQVECPALPTLHPAFLLRQPAAKKKAWSDLLTLTERLDRPAEHACVLLEPELHGAQLLDALLERRERRGRRAKRHRGEQRERADCRRGCRLGRGRRAHDERRAAAGARPERVLADVRD